MKLHNFIDKAYEQFTEKAATARIILLHPRSRYRSMLVAKLINSPDMNVFYYAMGPDDINLHAFISSISHDIANQHPTFGRHINMLPPETWENLNEHFEAVLETFNRDLAEISDEPYLLILDEYDRSDRSDDVQRFVESLSRHLGPNGRIVLNSRTLPRLPWIAMLADGRAVILEDDSVIQEDFYEIGQYGTSNFEVFGLGPGFVLSGNEPVDNWEGHLPRLLFFFALDRPIVTRSEICSAFWPDLDSDQAVNVFHVTKRRLHKALDTDVLMHDDGYYRVNPEMNIYYDVTEFVTMLVKGRNSKEPEERMAYWQRAADLYRGPFLQGHTDPWIEARRVEFRNGYLEALSEMAKVWVERGRAEQALSLYQKAASEDAGNLDVHRHIMQLYTDLGRRSEAVAHFQKNLGTLQAQDAEAAQQLQAFYDQMMA